MSTKEHTQTSLFELATNGLSDRDMDSQYGARIERAYLEGIQEAKREEISLNETIPALLRVSVRGVEVIRACRQHGNHRGVRSIHDARCLRLVLMGSCRMLDTVLRDSLLSGDSTLVTAEKIAGIRNEQGFINPEWK